MKTSAVFLLLFLAVSFTQGNAEPDGAADQGTEAACGNYDIRKGCTKNFDPVCGTDSVLYGNECLLCVQNISSPMRSREQAQPKQGTAAGVCLQKLTQTKS
uniref:Kazal-like domain-containing protein n=1 Tax=Gallus gallus TaxID=9031 RepID=A0A8V0YW26_CHICK